MSTLLIIVLLVVVFGGGLGFANDGAYRGYAGPGVGTILLVVLVLYLTHVIH